MGSSPLWILATGALVGASCALVGSFLVLRRLSMVGDAISHAILPGIVVAFLLTGSRASLPMFLGAAVTGLLATLLIQTLSGKGVQGDAAIGVTFTALFALGVVLVTMKASHVDLDVECVLHGELAYVGLDTVTFGGWNLGPRALWINGGILALNLAVIGLLFKEFKISAFDPGMAAAVGVPVAAMHYLLMGLVSLTTVAAFESVGAILVVAMLIVPGATAYLLTDRLPRMLGLAMALGTAASPAGYLLARALDASPAGAMATVSGVFFALAFLFSPSHGLVSRRLAQQRLRRRVAEEDLLLWAVRRRENGSPEAFDPAEAARALEQLPAETLAAARRLARRGALSPEGARFRLAPEGLARGAELLRSHRLYESYLDGLGYPADHQHAPAERAEHYLSPALTAAVEAAADHPERDPQGKPIRPVGVPPEPE